MSGSEEQERTEGREVGPVPTVVLERLGWQTACRDDKAVAAALHAGQEIDAMYELSEAGLLDEFFVFLEQIGMMEVIGELKFPNVKRVLVPTVQFVLLYLLRILFGVESMNALPKLLFSHVGLMKLVGFNATQIQEGLTVRGESQRKTKQKQGPITPQCLADNICKLTREQMEQLFNQMVCCLVQWGLLQGELMAALDGSKLPTTDKYQGCGKLKETKKVKIKGQKEPALQEMYIYGWKVLVLIEVQTRLPLAIKVVPIQEYEGRWLLPLLEIAQANLGERARICKIVVDRGYLDGEDLWQLHERGILFVIVGKAGMTVAEDAQAIAKGEPSKSRETRVTHGHGKKATQEILRTELVGISGLTTYDSYGDKQHTQHKNRRDFMGQPINAVVVQMWNNRAPSTDGIVYLTNGPVDDPFLVFDDYDWRSVIENGIFKEGKYSWHLLKFPQRNEAAVIVHCHFTLMMMGLCTAFRLWQASSDQESIGVQKPVMTGVHNRQQRSSSAQEQSALAATSPMAQLFSQEQRTPISPLSTALLTGEGTARWRARLKQENRDKVIVFVAEAYGIFHMAELAILMGMRLKELPSHLGTKEAILTRYGISP
jgi:hypothetical protein